MLIKVSSYEEETVDKIDKPRRIKVVSTRL